MLEHYNVRKLYPGLRGRETGVQEISLRINQGSDWNHAEGERSFVSVAPSWIVVSAYMRFRGAVLHMNSLSDELFAIHVT